MNHTTCIALMRCLAAACVVGMAQPAAAQILLNVASNPQPRTDGGKVVGISLNSYGETITSLGFYDHGGDGLAASYQLGLWDSAQNLLATATVTPSSPLTGDFRYAAIPPTTLGTFANPETFTIGALLPDDMQDVWLEDAQLVLWSGYTGAGTGQYTASGTLVYPATLDSSPYYVVNANGPAPPLPPIVPEPATFALLAAAGAFSLLRRRWR